MNGNNGRGRAGAVVIPALFALFAILSHNTIDRKAHLLQQDQVQYPEGVDQQKIAIGRMLFASEAGCHVCHGRRGQGISNWTSDLTDRVWLKIPDGTYEAIMAVIRSGIKPGKTGGVTMPPMGRNALTAEQVEALAAYLWSVNREATDQP